MAVVGAVGGGEQPDPEFVRRGIRFSHPVAAHVAMRRVKCVRGPVYLQCLRSPHSVASRAPTTGAAGRSRLENMKTAKALSLTISPTLPRPREAHTTAQGARRMSLSFCPRFPEKI